MTQKVNPSPFRPAEAFKTAGSIYYNNDQDNYVVPGSNTTVISNQDGGIDETQFTGFNIVSGPSSLDVTIEPGEAFIFGSWLAKDTNTTITLSANQSNVIIYVGWDKSSSDEVIIGPNDGRFATSSGDTDQKIPLWEVNTDGSGVTKTIDSRDFGGFGESLGYVGKDELPSDKRLEIDSDEYMVVGGSYTLNGDATIDGDLVTVQNSPSHDGLSDVDPTDHLEVLKEYQIVAKTGTTPAFDGTLSNVLAEELTAFEVTVAPTSGANGAYAFNYDDGKQWNNGSWDVPLTVNWDDDLGSDLGLTVRIHKRT